MSGLEIETPNSWRREFWNHKYLIILSGLLLIFAVILDHISGLYVSRVGDALAPDLILDFLPVVNLNFIYVWGFVGSIALLFLYPFFFKIRKFHVVASHFSLLVIVRSFFISLTHLKTPLDAAIINFPSWLSILSYHNDLFFSGHTAIPFLGFLLFRKQKIGIFFLIMTIVLAITVLLMHVHYSIDVFAALFITYGVFQFGNWFVRRVKG